MKKTNLKILQLLALPSVVMVGTLNAGPAMADAPSGAPNFMSTSNKSDPFITKCGVGYCMVASKDLGDATGKYHMKQTFASYSTDGLTWSAPTVAINESSLPGVPTINGAYPEHLWAPALLPTRNNAGVYTYYLYTPDITRTKVVNGQTVFDTLSSRVWVSSSSSPTGPFTSLNTVSVSSGGGSGYMSDPEVFADTSSPETDRTHDYLLWADGDNGTCGALRVAPMSGFWSTNSATTLTINNWPSWATCKTSVALNDIPANTELARPYVEGASLFRFERWNVKTTTTNPFPGRYTLVFAAKPRDRNPPAPPPGCSSSNEVIAYATSNSVTGPYDYQGIIMCGSSTEWTNQATIEEVLGPDGAWRLAMVYHDGPSGNNNRKTRAECLYLNGGFFIPIMRSADGIAGFNNGVESWCLNHLGMESLQVFDASNAFKYIKADANDSGKLKATSSALGPWEQFDLITISTTVYIHARGTNKYVQTQSDGSLKALGTSQGTNEAFDYIQADPQGNEMFLRSRRNNLYVVRNSSNQFVASGTTQSQAARFYYTVHHQ